MRSVAGTVGSLAAFGMALGVAHAAPSEWRNMPYSYTVVDQSVTDVLKNFGYNSGLRMSIAPDISGVVHGRIDATTAGDFLDAVTKSHALDWYYDGAVMYVSPASAELTATVPLHGASFSAIKQSVERLGLLDDRYKFSTEEHGAAPDFVVVAGPPSYVAVIKQAVESSAGVTDGALVIYRGSQSANVNFHDK